MLVVELSFRFKLLLFNHLINVSFHLCYLLKQNLIELVFEINEEFIGVVALVQVFYEPELLVRYQHF